MRASIVALLLAMPSLAVAQPKPGTVTGTVKVLETNGAAVKGATVIVYVVGPPVAAGDKPVTSKIDQKDQTFRPDLIAVTVGDSVIFPNMDKTLHNVFSPNKFDLGSLKGGEGKDKPQKFDKQGVVDVYCNIHPKMAATIIVLPNRFYKATSDGTFTIENVPPGEWSVFAYTRRSTKPAQGKIKVVAGEKVSVDLSVTRGPEVDHKNKFGGNYGGYTK